MNSIARFVLLLACLYGSMTINAAPTPWQKELRAGDAAWERKDYDTAERHFNSAMQAVELEGNELLEAFVRRLVTYVAEEKSGKYKHTSGLDITFPNFVFENEFYQGAKTALKRIIERKKLDTPSSLYMPLIALGWTYHYEGNLHKADSQFEQVIQIYDQEPEWRQFFGGWGVLILAADYYQETRRFKLAQQYYKRALPFSEETDGADSVKYGYTLVKLAANHFYQQHYVEAEEFFLRAATIFEAESAASAHANVLQWLAEIARVKGLEDQAEEFEIKAKKLLLTDE